MGLLAGIIEGGLQGGAQAVQGMAQDDIAQQHKIDLQQQLSDQELAKMKAAAVFNAEQQNALREAQVTRIDAAQKGLVDSRIAQQFPGLPGAEDGGDNGLRNAQDANADAARTALMNDPHTRVQAAESTGDVPVGTMATLLQKNDNSQNTLLWRMQQDQTKADNAQLRADTQLQLAQGNNETKVLVASMIRDAKQRDNREEMANARLLLSDTSRNLDERRKERADANNQLPFARTPEAKDAVNARIKDLDSQIANLKESHDIFYAALADKETSKAGGTSAGATSAPKVVPPPKVVLPPGGASAPAPGASAPSAAPKAVHWNELK